MYDLLIEQLSIIEGEIDSIENKIISELNLLNNKDFIKNRKENLFNSIEIKLLKLKKANIKGVNPLIGKYSEYELLEIYPFYAVNKIQKEKINKKINNIIEEGNEKALFNLFLFLFLEKRDKEMLNVFKILVRKKNMESINIMLKYFLFKGNPNNYGKLIELKNKINN